MTTAGRTATAWCRCKGRLRECTDVTGEPLARGAWMPGLVSPRLQRAALRHERAEDWVPAAQSDAVEVADDDTVGLP